MKVSDIDILKLLNFVLFACLSLGRQVSFVVKCFFYFDCGSVALNLFGEYPKEITLGAYPFK